MKVYLIRHGESESNALRIHQDHTPKLTEKGRAQAEFAAHRLRNVPLEKIIASPYPRAHETATIIGHTLDLPVEESELLVETRRPSEVVHQSHDSAIAQEVERAYRENLDNQDWKYSDEESFAETRKRGIDALALIAQHTEEKLLVVSHGNFMRMLVALVLFGEAMTPREFQNFREATLTNNTGITILSRHTDCAHREGDHWQLISWNDHAHLA